MVHKNPNAYVERSQEQGRPPDLLSSKEKQRVVRQLNEELVFETVGEKLFLHEERSIGNNDSAHDVFFVETRPDAKRWYSSYACKRFKRREKAERELEAMREASDRGFTTLVPAGEGIFDVRDVGSVLVTRTKPRITTMNHIGWADTFPGQEDYEKKIGEPLERIAAFVGEMHQKGIHHGDLQLKNVAVDARNRFLLFDLEDAEFFDDSNDFIAIEKFVDDFKKLVDSLVDRGFLWDTSDDVFMDEVDSRIVEPYLSTNDAAPAVIIDRFHDITQDALVRRQDARSKFSEKWRDTYEDRAA